MAGVTLVGGTIVGGGAAKGVFSGIRLWGTTAAKDAPRLIAAVVNKASISAAASSAAPVGGLVARFGGVPGVVGVVAQIALSKAPVVGALRPLVGALKEALKLA